MPSWPIHLAISKQLNRNWNLPKSEFIYGNIMPDADGRLVPISVSVPRKTSHFSKEIDLNGKKVLLPDVEAFRRKYQSYIDNPVVIGYLVHLLTDYYFNRIFNEHYCKYNKEGDFIGVQLKNQKFLYCSYNEANRMKQKDFAKFEYLLEKNNMLGKSEYEESIYHHAGWISEFSFTESDVISVMKYIYELQVKEVYSHLDIDSYQYQIFSESILLTYFYSCINFIHSYFDHYQLLPLKKNDE